VTKSLACLCITILCTGCNLNDGFKRFSKSIDCEGLHAEVHTETLRDWRIIPWLQGHKAFTIKMINLSDQTRRIYIGNGYWGGRKFHEWTDIKLYPKERCCIYRVELKYGKFLFDVHDKSYKWLGRETIDMTLPPNEPKLDRLDKNGEKLDRLDGQ